MRQLFSFLYCIRKNFFDGIFFKNRIITAPKRKSPQPPCGGPSPTKSLPTPELRWYYFGVESFLALWPHRDHICVRIAYRKLRRYASFSSIPFIQVHLSYSVCHVCHYFLSPQAYIFRSLKISLLKP